MANYREGESITMEMRGLDANGEVMSEVEAKWYGYDNATANAIQGQVITALLELTAQWSDVKNGSVEVEKRGVMR
jgi:hypothetical protein